MKPSPTAALRSLKPYDRVLRWLDTTIPTHQRRSGVRIPTTREVSREINVSSGTVQKVYQHLAEKGLIQTEVGSGTFWTKAAEGKPGRRTDVLKIGINVGLPKENSHSESWSGRIFSGMFHSIIGSAEPLSLVPIALFNDCGEFLEERLELLEGISGFISFPTPTAGRMDALLRQRHIPHITLNPLSASSTTNFVAPSYFESNRLASSAFARAGRKRLLLVLSPGTEHSVSCQLRLSGFASGLHLGGQEAEFRTLVTPDGAYEQGVERFAKFLKKGWIPDAVCTAGDALAQGVLDVALEHGISVPEEMSIIGGSGTLPPEPDAPHRLTAMTQPLEKMGERLIATIIEAIGTPDQPRPGENLPAPFTIGTTTRAAEHPHLNVLSPLATPGTPTASAPL